MKIQVVLGSTRPGRIGERVAKWVTAVAAQQPGVDVELLDLRDYDMPHFNEPASPRFNPHRDLGEAAERWLGKLAAADGYVIVTPEYNHSIPGVLKNAFDYIDFQVQKKPAAIVSYGSAGGARAAEHLKGILIESKAAVVPEALALIGVHGLLDEAGGYLGDPEAARSPQQQLTHILSELGWWAKTLKAGRSA